MASIPVRADRALNDLMANHRVAVSSPLRPSIGRGSYGRPDATADLAGLAWEFLRRNRAYRADFERLRPENMVAFLERWGLNAPVDPDAPRIDAGAIWSPAARPLSGSAQDAVQGGPQAAPRSRRRGGESSAGSPPTSARCSDRACPDALRGCRTGA